MSVFDRFCKIIAYNKFKIWENGCWVVGTTNAVGILHRWGVKLVRLFWNWIGRGEKIRDASENDFSRRSVRDTRNRKNDEFSDGFYVRRKLAALTGKYWIRYSREVDPNSTRITNKLRKLIDESRFDGEKIDPNSEDERMN
jgi:hypothetical protein